jgi:hypothetical protein
MDSDFLISAGLWLSYILFFAAVGAATIFPIYHIIKSPKNMARSGMGIGLMAVVFGIAYLLAGSEITTKYIALGVKSEFSSKMIGAGLTMFYLIFLIAILSMIYSEISKAFK